MVTRYRSIFATPQVTPVILTGLLARLPVGMCSLTILLALRAQFSSFALPGVAVGAYAAANALSSPLQGRLVDRRGRTAVLGISTAGWVAALVAFLVAAGEHAPGWTLVLISASIGATMPPFAASVRALLGEMIDDGAVRDAAYGLDAILQEVVWIGGPLLVGGVVAAGSPSDAVLLTLGVGAVGAVGLLAVAPRSAVVRPHTSHWAGALTHRGLRTLLVPMVLVGIGLGSTEVGLPAIAVHAGDRAVSGVLIALWAGGSILGGLAFAARRRGDMPLVARLRILLVGVAVGQAPLIFARTVPSAAVLAVVAGLAVAPAFTCLYTLVGRLAPPGTETEAFTWTSTAFVAGTSIGFAAAGALSATVGLSGPFVLSVAITLAAAALTWRLLPVDVDRQLPPAPQVGVEDDAQSATIVRSRPRALAS